MLVVSDMVDVVLPLPEDLLGTFRITYPYLLLRLNHAIRGSRGSWMRYISVTPCLQEREKGMCVCLWSLSHFLFSTTLCLIHSLFHSFSHTHAHILAPSISFTLSHTHTKTNAHTLTFFSLSLSLSLSQSPRIPRRHRHSLGCSPLHVQRCQSTRRYVRST